MPVRISRRRSTRMKSAQGMLGMGLFSGAIVIAALLLRSGGGDAQAGTVSPVVGQFDTVLLPVPVEQVAAGTKVKSIRFKQVAFPRHQVPDGAVKDIGVLLESVAVAPLPANLPLFAQNFSATAMSNPVIERIPQGMRAMTIRVDATSSVEGWAGSGAVVDVLLGENDRTTVVAERVKILSSERSVSPVDGAMSPNVPSTVTLLVSQEQCLAINTAIPRGKISFALRSSRDEDAWGATTYNASQLVGGSTGTPERSLVNGFVSVRGADSKEAFALTNGKWVRTDSVPAGFFAGKRPAELVSSEGEAEVDSEGDAQGSLPEPAALQRWRQAANSVADANSESLIDESDS